MNGRDGQPSFVHSLGARVLGLVSYVGGLVLLLGAALRLSWQGALGRRASREATAIQMVRVGVHSVAIVSLVQLFIGVILALQMAPPLEPLGQLDKISMIIGVAGPNGAGKGEVVQYLAERSFYPVSLSDVIRGVLRDRGIEETRERIILRGDVPSPANPPVGCNFSTRCPRVIQVCHEIDPEFKEVAPGHWCACHLVG